MWEEMLHFHTRSCLLRRIRSELCMHHFPRQLACMVAYNNDNMDCSLENFVSLHGFEWMRRHGGGPSGPSPAPRCDSQPVNPIQVYQCSVQSSLPGLFIKHSAGCSVHLSKTLLMKGQASEAGGDGEMGDGRAAAGVEGDNGGHTNTNNSSIQNE